MLIGYARVSKADGSQSLDLQRDALRAEGIDGKAYDLGSNLEGGLVRGGRPEGNSSKSFEKLGA